MQGCRLSFCFLKVSCKAVKKIIICCCTFLCRFYKGLPPLWMRQIPYTMMKFACFERTVEALYKYVVPKPRSDCSKPEQLVVTFAAGYIAGVFCAVVSHPADTVVSKLNNDVGSTPIQAAKELGMKGTRTVYFSFLETYVCYTQCVIWYFLSFLRSLLLIWNPWQLLSLFKKIESCYLNLTPFQRHFQKENFLRQKC